MTPLYLEDHRPGRRFTSGVRQITADDIADFTRLSGDANPVHTDPAFAAEKGFAGPLAHGPLGVAVIFGLLHDLGVADGTAIALLDLNWRFRGPLVAGDSVRFEMTVTRCRRSSRGDAGVVNRHVTLAKTDGTVVGAGSTAFLVAARDPQGPPTYVGRDFATPAWAERLAAHLADNPEFAAGTATFDGSIGLAAGPESVQLRVYRGRVLETGRWTPSGPTFTLHGEELAWVELADAPRNDFIARSMRGAFGVTGNTYEHLRLHKAIVAAWDSIRALAAEEAA